MPNPPSSITIMVNNSGSHFSPQNSSVANQGTVTLKSSASSQMSVCTYNSSGSLISAFTSGSPPYSAPTGNGTSYTLSSSVNNTTITIATTSSSTCSSSPPTFNDDDRPMTGSNGTINVGGGTGRGDGDDDGDD